MEPLDLDVWKSGKLGLFLLAGQSNMSGRAEYPDPPYKASPSIWLFGNDYEWRIATEPIDNPLRQVDQISLDPKAKFSIAMPFCWRILERVPGAKIGLIPCAKGGTSIQEWQRSYYPNSLYGSMLKRAHIAQKRGFLAGLLFSQGERDAFYYPVRNEWHTLFVTFVNNLREDLGINLPVVFAQLHTIQNKQYQYWERVQQEQALAETQLDNVIMVKTSDIANSGVHYNTDETIRVGRRFANSYISLVRRSRQP